MSIGQLFLGGILPGLLMGIYLMVVAWIVARRRGYGAGAQRATPATRSMPHLPGRPAGDADADLGGRRHRRRHSAPQQPRPARLQVLYTTILTIA